MAQATAIKTRNDVTAKFIDGTGTPVELALDCFLAMTDPTPSPEVSEFECPRTGVVQARRTRSVLKYPLSLTVRAKEFTNASAGGDAVLDWVRNQTKGATPLISTDTALGWVWTVEITVAAGSEQSAPAVKQHLKVGLDPAGTIEHTFGSRVEHNTFTIPLVVYGGYTFTGELA